MMIALPEEGTIHPDKGRIAYLTIVSLDKKLSQCLRL